jgi:phosphoribosylaminoimidazole-succinocarboxamide synthase
MTKIPKGLPLDPTTKYLLDLGHKPIHEGKVRNTFKLPSVGLLPVATDRISIFDFVLNATVPRKGEYLTAITHFIMMDILKDIPNHLIPSKLNPAFNAVYDLKMTTMPDLPLGRCLVVEDLTGQLDKFELIFRMYIGGSVYKKYLTTGKVAGQKIPLNLPKWSKLEKPIFTPSTKETEGHDVNITSQKYFRAMKKLGVDAKPFISTLREACVRYHAYCAERGILILDTKYEGSSLLRKIADEILTPDSSRYTTIESWEKAVAEGKDPIFLDKEVVRIYGKKVETPFLNEKNEQIIGINNLNPKNQMHVDFVHSLTIPEEVINAAVERYQEIFQRLVGMTLDKYQKEKMGVW